MMCIPCQEDLQSYGLQGHLGDAMNELPGGQSVIHWCLHCTIMLRPSNSSLQVSLKWPKKLLLPVFGPPNGAKPLKRVRLRSVLITMPHNTRSSVTAMTGIHPYSLHGAL